MPFEVGDRIYHKEDHNCTGTVIEVQSHNNYGYYDLVKVQWDDNESPVDWYSAGYLKRIPYSSPPPRLEVKEVSMSQALWCDKGGHAFSAKDPDREHYTSTKSITEGQRVTQVTAELDICGRCVKESVLVEAPALTASVVQDRVPAQEASQ